MLITTKCANLSAKEIGRKCRIRRNMDMNEKIVKSDEYKNKIRLDACQSKIYTSHIQYGNTSENESHHEKEVQGKHM